MFYTKVQVAVCDTVTFKRAPLAARGVWLQLSILCAKEENRGVIVGARGFDETTWIMACGLKRRDIEGAVAAGLLAWQADALVVLGYDQTGEDRHAFNRQVGNLGGRPRKNPTPVPGYIHPDNQSDNRPVLNHETPSKPSQTKPAAAAADPEPDPRLVAAAAAGGYLDCKGQDLRDEWLIAVGEDPIERISEVMAFGRRKTGKPVRMPSAYVDHRLAMLEQQRQASARLRIQAEANALRETERAQTDEKTKQALAAAARNRALVGGVLVVHDEDPRRWAQELTEAQARVLADLRALHDAGRPLGLSMRHLETLPPDLVAAGTARGREMQEQTEGATP